MLPVEPNARVQGNNEVIEVLNSWLLRAQLGKVNFVGIVACEGHNAVFRDHAGVPESYFAAYFGLDNLRNQLSDILLKAPINGAAGEGPADRVCYDLSVEPCSFDFLVWLLSAELRRIREGAPAPLKVAFMSVDYPRGWHEGLYLTAMRPAVELMGGVIDQTHVATGRRLNCYTAAELATAARRGEEIPKFRYAANPVCDGTITITLREAAHWKHRNSNIPEWIKFADWLIEQGEKVVFIRDTDKAAEPIDGHTTNVRAAFDLRTRLELYEKAKCNLFVPNGPATLCQFGVSPYLLFWKPDPDDTYAPNTPGWMQAYAGIIEGEQFPWAAPNQRIAWTTDTFENIKAAWLEWNRAGS